MALAAVVVVAIGYAGSAGVDPSCNKRGVLGTSGVVVADGAALGVWGWAYDPAGVREIRVMSGGKLVGRSAVTDERRDVADALPRCPASGNTGFAFVVPTGPAPVGQRDYEVLAVTGKGQAYPVGKIELRFDRPIGYVAPAPPVRWNGANTIEGWAVSRNGNVTVKLMAVGREIATTSTNIRHVAVERIFSEWPAARTAGFRFDLAMRNLPRGRYPTMLRLEDEAGRLMSCRVPMSGTTNWSVLWMPARSG